MARKKRNVVPKGSKKEDNERINFYLSKDLKKWVEVESELEGKTMSLFIINCIERYREQKMVMQNLSNMENILQRLEYLELQEKKRDEKKK